MKQINTILTKYFLEKNINCQKMSEYDIIINLLQKYIASIEDISFKDGILSLEVMSNIHRFELNVRKKQILMELNKLNIRTKIKDLKIITKGQKSF